MSSGPSGGSGGSSEQTQKLDPWLKGQIGQNLSNIRGLEGYQPYASEDAIAGFTPEMQQQMQQMQAMGQQGAGLMDQGASSLQDAANVDPQQVTGGQEQLAQFQNPYQQQVVDQTINDMDRARQMAVGQSEDQAISRGAFGGDRQAIVEAETNRNFADRTASAVGQLNQQGFNTALNASLTAQQANQGAGLDAARLQMLAGQGLLGAGQGMFGMGQQAAQMGQNQEQAIRDFDYQQYQQAFQDPRQLAQMEAAAIQGIPTIGTTTGTQQGGSGSSMGNALGGAASGAAIGSEIMPGWGTAIGGGVGLLGGMFG